jgi:acyl-CoA synthetase (AMP-forming)/AMP-acid ligase II
VIVPVAGAQLASQDLIDWCGARLPGYMKPRRVEFAESLPRSPLGKMLRRVLREPYWQGEESAI